MCIIMDIVDKNFKLKNRPSFLYVQKIDLNAFNNKINLDIFGVLNDK